MKRDTCLKVKFFKNVVKEVDVMAKLTEVMDYRHNGVFVKGYRIALRKKGIEQTGFTKDSDLEITYKKGKIIIEEKKQK